MQNEEEEKGGYGGTGYVDKFGVPHSSPAQNPRTTVGMDQTWCQGSVELVEGNDSVNHPKHYKGAKGIEVIDVIENFDLGFCLGNAIKYICRAGKKDPAKKVEDLKKAIWYLEREINA